MKQIVLDVSYVHPQGGTGCHRVLVDGSLTLDHLMQACAQALDLQHDVKDVPVQVVRYDVRAQ